MGLSLTSAMIGLGVVIIGAVLIVLRKQKRLAIVLLIVGIVLIIVPYGTIYLFLD